MNRTLREDLETIIEHVDEGWERFRGKTVFLTGGTGFIGSWLCGAFLWADRRFDLGLRLAVLSRDPDSFKAKRPEIAEIGHIEFVKGDVRDFAFPAGRADFIVNAATEASAKLNAEAPIRMMDTIVDGTRRVAEYARSARPERLLFLSSGAVYGQSRDGADRFAEGYNSAPSCVDPAQAYGEAKRLAELYTVCAARRDGYDAIIARCFAFVGPYLPLDMHFAIGNFIKDGLAGRTIRITGDGKPLRSYMYVADLAETLIRLLISAEAFQPYNVGSDEAVSIGELGMAVSEAFDGVGCEILGESRPTDRNQDYLPDIGKLKRLFPSFLGLDLRASIERTKRYHQEA
jgi:nucleoside-diphosphate-sugar epimerase